MCFKKLINRILKYISKTILLSLSAVIITGCATYTHAPVKKHKNLSYLYNDSEVFLHPNFQIYNFAADSSKVYVKIPIEDLLIKDLGPDYEKYALVKIHYRVYESLSISSLIDSATFTQRIFVDKDNKTFHFNIKTPNLQKSYLKIRVTDVFSERKRHDYLYINKRDGINRQSFLIKGQSKDNVLFGNKLQINNSYKIEGQQLNKYPLFIQEGNLIASIPNIPSSTSRTNEIKYNSDTTYLCENNIIRPTNASILLLNFDTTKINGLVLFAQNSTKNRLKMPSEMLKSTTYLLSNDEYDILLNDSNPKFALDKFWLKLGGNTRHASDMIKVYYNRVSTANKYFSSYKEGWMTDRGMIYIIYGEPATVYKSEILERWIYGSMDSEQSLSFDFELIKNRLSKNNFELIRAEEYKKSWFQAIDAWRNGRIYSIAR